LSFVTILISFLETWKAYIKLDFEKFQFWFHFTTFLFLLHLKKLKRLQRRDLVLKNILVEMFYGLGRHVYWIRSWNFWLNTKEIF
jgi:hypothetical protein